jgi:hypothetical protein
LFSKAKGFPRIRDLVDIVVLPHSVFYIFVLIGGGGASTGTIPRGFGA